MRLAKAAATGPDAADLSTMAPPELLLPPDGPDGPSPRDRDAAAAESASRIVRPPFLFL